MAAQDDSEDPTDTTDTTDNSAAGAAGAVAPAVMAASPWAGVGAAGLSTVGGLFTALMQQQAAKEAEQRKALEEQHLQAQRQVTNAQTQQLGTVARMGQSQQNALDQLIAAVSRTVR